MSSLSEPRSFKWSDQVWAHSPYNSFYLFPDIDQQMSRWLQAKSLGFQERESSFVFRTSLSDETLLSLYSVVWGGEPGVDTVICASVKSCHMEPRAGANISKGTVVRHLKCWRKLLPKPGLPTGFSFAWTNIQLLLLEAFWI